MYGRDVEVLPDIRELDTTWDQVRFIDALSESFFRTPDELDALLTRAKEDPGWRRARVEHARKLVEAAFTYERAAEGIVGFLGESIARSARVTPIAS